MSFPLTGLQTAVTFIVILAVLVFFHELGHFGAAKLFKMRVEEFALGFGKRLLRVGYDGQTEYNLRAVPLGGFVRIAGMEIEDAVERRLTGGGEDRRADAGMQTTNTGLIEQEAREVDGHDPDGFNNRPLFQRFVVILAGPVFSVVLGWLAFCLVGLVYGVPVQGAKLTTRIERVFSSGAAAQAGLKAGDTIVTVDGATIRDGEALVKQINTSPDRPLRFAVRDKSGRMRDVTVVPRPVKVGTKTVGRIGIAPYFPTRRAGLAESFAAGNERVVVLFAALGEVFARGQAREVLGGPIAIFRETSGAVDAGGPSPLLLLGQLSLSIGIFNLLPIPVLDGGHLALLTLEGIRGRKLTALQTQRVLVTGLAILASLFVWVMFNDITRWIRAS